MEPKMLEAHMKEYGHFYESGVLVPEHHYRLVMSAKKVTDSAGIPVSYLGKAMSSICGEEEIAWLKKLNVWPESGVAGLVYHGSHKNMESRMMLMVAACLRNYIDARFMTVQQVVEAVSNGSELQSKLVVIPNFFLKKSEGGDLPSWHTSGLLGMLYNRLAAGKLTVLYVQSLSDMGAAYGRQFRDHLEEHYKIMEGM